MTAYNRILFSDGKFLYNCSVTKVIKQKSLTDEFSDIAVVGIIENSEKEIRIPSHFAGQKIELVSGIDCYRKGRLFPEITDDFVKIPFTVDKVKGYYTYQKYVPDTDFLIPVTSPCFDIINCGKIEIDRNAFRENKTIRKIVSEKTVIKSETFMNCNNLQKIELSKKLHTIGTKTFYGCKNLDYIPITSTIKRIGSYAFAETQIKFLAIPPGVTEIMPYTFYKCKKLDMVFIPPEVTKISKSAFEEANEALVIIGKENSCAQKFAQKHQFRFIPYSKLPVQKFNETLKELK